VLRWVLRISYEPNIPHEVKEILELQPSPNSNGRHKRESWRDVQFFNRRFLADSLGTALSFCDHLRVEIAYKDRRTNPGLSHEIGCPN
jgi:hypothetical protein